MMHVQLMTVLWLVAGTLLAATAAAQSPHHTLNPSPELLQASENRLWENMRKAYTTDELHAFIRTHPTSEHVPTALTRLGRSEQRDINTLQHVLDILATQAPSADLSDKMGIADAQQLKSELQSYLKTRRTFLTNAQARHRAMTGKDIDMDAAKTGLYGKVLGDVPSPMFSAPMHPLPYRVGYSWTMRMEDVLTKKTTDYTRSVTQLLPYGYIEINDGKVLLDSDGNINYQITSERKRSFNIHYRQHPQSLQRGREHTFGYAMTDTMSDGKVFTQKGSNASMTSIQTEDTPVPAGTFPTWRVARKADWTVLETGNSGTFTFTGWYSPELRRYVKWEEISRNAEGTVLRHERHELLRTD
jgi:hypothetical protein